MYQNFRVAFKAGEPLACSLVSAKKVIEYVVMSFNLALILIVCRLTYQMAISMILDRKFSFKV